MSTAAEPPTLSAPLPSYEPEHEHEHDSDDLPHSDAHARTWSYYAALLLVVPVWAITPLSWLFLLFEAYQNGARLVPRHASSSEKVLVIWALLEVRSNSLLTRRTRTNTFD